MYPPPPNACTHQHLVLCFHKSERDVKLDHSWTDSTLVPLTYVYSDPELVPPCSPDPLQLVVVLLMYSVHE